MSEFASESTHWYDAEGNPCHTQVVQSGKRKGLERPTTLRDARKLCLFPSVTTITSILDKPALTAWKCRQAAERALASERGEDFEENNSAEIGSKIHGAIEKWLEGKPYDAKYQGYVDVVEKVLEEIGVEEPASEVSFCSYGYGGAVDLHDRKANIILDFKTKDEVEKGKDYHYDEHAMQLGAYRLGLDMPEAVCYNLFLSRSSPSNYCLHRWEEAEIERGTMIFTKLLSVWRLIKRMGYGE